MTLNSISTPRDILDALHHPSHDPDGFFDLYFDNLGPDDHHLNTVSSRNILFRHIDFSSPSGFVENKQAFNRQLAQCSHAQSFFNEALSRFLEAPCVLTSDGMHSVDGRELFEWLCNRWCGPTAITEYDNLVERDKLRQLIPTDSAPTLKSLAPL